MKGYIGGRFPWSITEEARARDLLICEEFFKTASALVQRISPNMDTSVYSSENRQMRKNAALNLRSMWFCLISEYKEPLMNKILRDLLLVTLVDDPEIRLAMIPIFYDMLWIEPYQAKFVDDFIQHLDPLIDKGMGNAALRIQLETQLKEQCSEEDLVQLDFIERVDRLLGLLLNLREVRNQGDSIESGKLCLMELVNFYGTIKQEELKVHHIHNLYLAHMQSDSPIEAAFTLLKIAKLLDWSYNPIPMCILKRGYHRGGSNQASLHESLFV